MERKAGSGVLLPVYVIRARSTFGGGLTDDVRQGSLRDPATAVVTLRLDEAGGVWHVEFSSNSSVCSSPSLAPTAEDILTITQSSTPKVMILKPTPGPQPYLNKPVVLTPEGKIPVPEVEKSFLQKYWWVLLGGAVLMMTTGGGGGE